MILKNVENFKETKTNELFGAIGYLSELELIKKNTSLNSKQLIDT